MGCDIHMYVERLNDKGEWVSVPESEGPKHPYYDPKGTADHKKYFDKPDWTTGRNYVVFGRLAGVRADSIVPISNPKGVPNNLSEETVKEWNDWNGDAHSASWFTAKELLIAKDGPIKCRACLSISQYKEYLKNEKTKIPEDDEKWIWGRPRKVSNLISNEEMERIIKLSAFWDGVEYLTDVIYDDPEIVERFDDYIYTAILVRMLEIEPDPEKIRIVFWFDN